MARLFGTDGIRGRVGTTLTVDLAQDVAAAAGSVLSTVGGSAVVGMDTRESGPALEAAVVEGLTSVGVDVICLGVVTTPAVAFLTAHLGADLGVVISASHNPAPDNGLKVIGPDGRKTPDDIEDRIEAAIGDHHTVPRGQRKDGRPDVESYRKAVLASVPEGALTGLHVVVDCANGAASELAPGILANAGATVTVIGAEPNGTNINDGHGATHLEALQAAVLKHGAQAGVAFDGDADRCLAVDEFGNVVDGDQILLILALAMRAKGELPDKTVVATVMSNLGFARALEREKLTLIRAAVGDRYVLEEMLAGGHVLGGEQSGHVIMANHATTGDGVLTALHLLAELCRSGKPMSELAALMTRMPQILLNCHVTDPSVFSSPVLAEAVAKAERTLGPSGRVLVRPSGTEALIRVMVEADTQARAEEVAECLAAVVGSL